MTDSPLAFGSELGVAPGGVAAYSSDYNTADTRAYPSRRSFRSFLDGIYMGHKWQCVEFARRWLYVNTGCIFDDVAMAYEIFEMRSLRHVDSSQLLPLNAFRNGSPRVPEVGSLLIWEEGGEFEHTGHVAIITEVLANSIRIVEQNVDHRSWQGRNYARELPVKISEQGEFWITCSTGNAQILGWMIQTDDSTHAEPTLSLAPELLEVRSARVDAPASDRATWLNIANPDEAAYVAAMKGHCLTQDPMQQTRYLCISRSAQEELKTATNELHQMFMQATNRVLESDELLARFNLPPDLLPKLRASWDNRLNEVITSRFDFALTPAGLKVYEYNCDSASCYMEAAKVQGKWAAHFGLRDGFDPGQSLYRDIVAAWRRCAARNHIHILIDDDPEELYHALFMQSAIDAAGLRSTLLVGLEGCERRGDRVCDPAGQPIEWLWKTWAWETAIDEWRKPAKKGKGDHSAGLADVLLADQVMVFEPLWSLVPSNKAILPVLWELYPNHPYLLNASFELTDALRQSGYVRKPIVGRCGHNIAIIGTRDDMLESSDGAFDETQCIYQQFFPLPKIADYYTQICTFTAAGLYAGAGVRVDRSMITNRDSDCLALRVFDDSYFARSSGPALEDL